MYALYSSDAIFLYSMLRHLKPSRLIEVGSGFSSAVTLDTNEQFLDGQLQCTFIDPDVSRIYDLLSGEDQKCCRILQSRVQDVPLSVFGELEAGDVLFIDSSHVSKTGSDLNHILFEIVPSLPVGVHIHFVDLGGFYLDVIKDRQYTMQKNSVARRSCQTAIFHIAEAMVRWLAPVLSFTAARLITCKSGLAGKPVRV